MKAVSPAPSSRKDAKTASGIDPVGTVSQNPRPPGTQKATQSPAAQPSKNRIQEAKTPRGVENNNKQLTAVTSSVDHAKLGAHTPQLISTTHKAARDSEAEDVPQLRTRRLSINLDKKPGPVSLENIVTVNSGVSLTLS